MATKKTSEKMDKQDHAGMNKAAKIFKNIVVVGGLICTLVPGLKGLSNIIKKS